MKKIIAVLFILGTFGIQAQQAKWFDDVDEAIKVSQETKKPILEFKQAQIEKEIKLNPKPWYPPHISPTSLCTLCFARGHIRSICPWRIYSWVSDLKMKKGLKWQFYTFLRETQNNEPFQNILKGNFDDNKREKDELFLSQQELKFWTLWETKSKHPKEDLFILFPFRFNERISNIGYYWAMGFTTANLVHISFDS